MTESDSDTGSYSSDSLIRSGSAGTTSTIKPIKEGYLTKKGAVVSEIQLFGGLLLKNKFNALLLSSLFIIYNLQSRPFACVWMV